MEDSQEAILASILEIKRRHTRPMAEGRGSSEDGFVIPIREPEANQRSDSRSALLTFKLKVSTCYLLTYLVTSVRIGRSSSAPHVWLQDT